MKKNKLLLVSWVLGALYTVYLISHFVNGVTSTEGAEQAGAAIATALIMPHLIAVALATVFNIFGWAMSSKGFALTGAILYTVSLALFPLYFMFVMIQMILSFLGYSKLKKNKIIAE